MISAFSVPLQMPTIRPATRTRDALGVRFELRFRPALSIPSQPPIVILGRLLNLLDTDRKTECKV